MKKSTVRLPKKPCAADNSFRKNWPGYVLAAPSVLLVILLSIYPLLNGMGISFLMYDITRSTSPDFGKLIGLKNYITLGQNPAFWQAVRNTVVWTLSNVIAHFIIAMAAALALNKKLRFRGTFRVMSLIPWAIPSAIAALTFFFLFDTNVGIVNIILIRLGIIPSAVSWLGNPGTALPTVILESVWKGTPVMLIFILAALQGVPGEVYESAGIDGAGRIQAFFRITLPMIREPVAIAGVLDIIGTVNNFNAVWLMTRGGPLGSSEILYTYAYQNAFIQRRYGVAAANSVIIFLIVAVFSVVYIRLTTGKEEAP
jgi:multiple sugar transport system permease protein